MSHSAISEKRIQQVVCIRKYLSRCASFITEFFDLANAHPCDFIVSDHWDRLVPVHVQKQLFQLSHADLSMLLTRQHQEFDVHSCRADFGKDDNSVPPPADNHDEIKRTNIDGSVVQNKEYGRSLAAATTSVKQEQTEDQQTCGKYHKTQPGHNTSVEQTAWRGRSLDQFLCEAQTSYLENMSSVCTSSEMLLSWLQEGIGLSEDNAPFVRAFMKTKKEHEVETMAAVCRCLFHKCSADIVVDLGSGKGYLSTHLALHSGLPVVGIDSQASNTAGAEKRAKKLGAQWSHLIRTEQKKHVEKGIKGEKNGTKLESESTDVVKEEIVFDQSLRDIDSVLNAITESNNVEVICEDDKEEDIVDVAKDEWLLLNGPQLAVSGSLEKHHCRENAEVCQEQSSILLPPAMDGTNRNFSLTGTASKYANDASRLNMHAALTMFIGQDTRLVDVVHESASLTCPGKDQEKLKLLLTGLHTCGGLGSNVLRLFVKDNAVTSVCAVGCCYQLMQEKFTEDGISGENHEKLQTTYDFPMSSFLLDRKVQLGRSACNIASLSLPRMRSRKEVQGQSFYPRALLQAIIREKIGWVPPNLRHLRNLSKQATSPCDYVVKALGRLELPGCQVSAEDVAVFHKRHKHQEHKMAAFYQLQVVLAPVIEAVILLDRLLYLLEQDCVEDAFLVRLFDPVASPRCYALIATKV